MLRDWANACLDDLQRFESASATDASSAKRHESSSSGGSAPPTAIATAAGMTVRVTQFGGEFSDGLLLGRLLLYLALPRFEAQESPQHLRTALANRDRECLFQRHVANCVIFDKLVGSSYSSVSPADLAEGIHSAALRATAMLTYATHTR